VTRDEMIKEMWTWMAVERLEKLRTSLIGLSHPAHNQDLARESCTFCITAAPIIKIHDDLNERLERGSE